MLELKNIVWDTPDGKEIIGGIDLKIQPGKMTVVTGPNGGGKTSIAKLIAGIIKPTSGNIFMNEKDITHWDITKRAQNGIAYAFQQPVRFKGLTVRDLLEISAEEKISNPKLCEALAKVGLCAREYLERSVDASLSGGEIKRIEIATVLCRKNADILVFDEPEAGIDLWSFSKLIEVFDELKQERNSAFVVISHQERILDIADQIVVIADGKVKEEGSRDKMFDRLMSEEKQCRCPMKLSDDGGLKDE